jgi:diguanylate cyclase (GGDEF)-like protein/hemerythrin-like metal-binding protein/PAS domain S-box-containing protein
MKSIDIFPWDEHFNTGLEDVDQQHRKLVEILNRLASHIAYNSSEEDLNGIFDELTEYTLYHFQTEEAIWHQYLPDHDLDTSHQAVHQKFVDTVLKLKHDQSTRPLSELAEEALSFLARWLASHILESDRHMAHVVFALQEGLDIDAAKVRAAERMSGSTRLLIDIILSIYGTLSSNTLHLMRELKTRQKFEQQVAHQEHYRALLLELSTSFINLPLDDIDTNIEKALEKMARFVGADRAYVFSYDFDKQTTSNTYEWCAAGITPEIDALQDIPLDSLPGWSETHCKGESIIIQDVFGLDEGPVRDILVPQEIKSLVTVPLFENLTCKGFIGFDAVNVRHEFTPSEITLLELFSKLLSNVTQRKAHESELSHERSFLKTLFNALPDLIWIKDTQGIYLACNPRFEDFFGAKEADIIGKTDYDFVDKNLADFFKEYDNKVMRSGRPNINEETVIFASDGHEELLLTTKVPIYDEEGNITGIMGVGRDITSMKSIQQELERKERYQRALLDNFPFMIWLKDAQSHFLAVNQPMADAYGCDTPEDLIGKTDYDFWSKELADGYRSDDIEVLASDKPKTREEPVATLNGKVWAETYKSRVSIDGEVIGTVGFARDITDRKIIERKLIQERNLFERYLNTVEAIIVSLDTQGNITLLNRKGCELLGYNADELIGKPWFELCIPQPEGMQKVYPAFLKMMNGHLEKVEYFENYILTKSNEKRLIAWHNAYLLDDEDNIIGTLSSGEDITLLKEQQKQLEHMAHYDTLTNLPNRILLSDRLHQAMLQTQRHKLFLAIIYLDLDGFKEVNDTYGHSNGDILLKIVSSRVKQALRDGDTIARLGGDEFVIVLHDLKNEQDCLPMLKRILNTVSKPVISKEISMQVSASIGVTFYSQSDNLDADQLLRQADQAMYQAKLLGKNRFHFFDVQQDQHIRSHNESLEAIEKALKNDEFVMYYQPKVNMRSGEFLGVEALIRWNHPQYGLLAPGAFLPTIENHHLSIELDTWVLKHVLHQIEQWKKEHHHIIVSINISPMQLQQSDFILNLMHILESYPEVKSGDFEFEILETSALEDMNHISYIMKECNKIGIAFSLDDFGTGYSSLTYLKSLPAKQLKIDKSFVRDMLDDMDDMAILEGVISLASAFRRDVIAEGVERVDQGKMLLRLGCERAQGYIIAKPMPAQELTAWIDQWRPHPQWHNIKTVTRDDLPILYAITEHNIWINEVIAYLKQEQLITPALHHKQCRFGVWLYTQGVKRYKKREGFQKLETLHHDIHKNIDAIIKQYEADTLEDIDQSITQIQRYRDHFLEYFSQTLLSD